MYVTYLFTLAGPRVAKHVKETTRTTYTRAYTRPYQKMGMGKLKRNGNTYGTVRSVTVPFIARSIAVRRPFFKRVPVVRIEQGNFFFTPTVARELPFSR